jgi:hypothetical protein
MWLVVVLWAGPVWAQESAVVVPAPTYETEKIVIRTGGISKARLAEMLADLKARQELLRERAFEIRRMEILAGVDDPAPLPERPRMTFEPLVPSKLPPWSLGDPWPLGLGAPVLPLLPYPYIYTWEPVRPRRRR